MTYVHNTIISHRIVPVEGRCSPVFVLGQAAPCPSQPRYRRRVWEDEGVKRDMRELG